MAVAQLQGDGSVRSTVPPITVPAHPPSRRAPSSGVVLLVASFGAFLAFLDSTIVNIAFPDIEASFPGTPLGHLSWVLNSYNIVLAAVLVVAGRYADLVGRRRMFGIGILVFTLASVLCATAPTVEMLIVWRVLQGFGAAVMIPASLALVVHGFDHARRAHGVALWGAAGAIASGLGPPIGGGLVAVSGWRLAFLVNLPLGLLAYLASRRLLVESRSPVGKRRPDLRGAALLATAMGLLTAGLIQGPEWGWSDTRVVGAFALAVTALLGYVLSSRVSRAPLLDPALLRVRSFAVGNVLAVIGSTGFYCYLLTHVFYLHLVWDYSLLRAGLAVAPAAFVAAVAASVLGRLTDRHGHRWVIVPGALVWTGSLAWYATQVGPTPDFLGEWLPGQVLQGIGIGATLPILGSAALARLPKGDGYAVAAAVVNSSRQLGAVLGVSLLVVLVGTPSALDLRDRLERGWLFAAVCFLVVAVGAVLLGPTAQIEVEEPPVVTRAVPPEVLLGSPLVEPEPRDGVWSLADVPLFARLDPTVVALLEAAAERVDLDAGEYLFRAGDPSDALFVLVTGRLAVEQGGTVINELSRGSVLGELGLLTREARSACIRAVRDARLIRLTGAQFEAVADHRMLTLLAGGLATRLREIEPPAAPRRASGDAVIAVLGIGPQQPVDEVARAIAQRLSTSATVAMPGRVDRIGLERAEEAAQRVVLSAHDAGLLGSAEDREWWRTCLRVADRVVVVTGGAPLDELSGVLSGADILLTGDGHLHRRAWEAAVTPRSMGILGGDILSSTRPLADRLAGRSIGLVLGGGGARAFAHLGVLEVLEQAGVAIDRYAGTSVGAGIAALGAAGLDASTADGVVYESFVRNNPAGDITLPSKGLVRGLRVEQMLHRVFGDIHIEELPHEFRCVSVDLVSKTRCVLRRGSVAQAVGASQRLPGLYPPLARDGRLLVDGGVLDNLPVSTLDRSEGPIIAVTIGFDSGTSGGSSGRAPRVPALPDTLLRTMMLGSGAAAAEAMALADVVLRPDVRGTGLMEFHQIDAMREAGRAVARSALEELTSLANRG